MLDPYDWIDARLATITQAGWYRQPHPLSGGPGPVIQLGGQAVLNFASNDYLGLAGEPALAEAAMAAIRTWGTGSTGSRLLSGQREIHQQLETAIAQLKQTEAALVFSSGYLANLGTIAALVSERDLILADAYNHSSLRNGAILSGAKVLEYPHRDMEQLQSLLVKERPGHRRCLIVSDSVFSMDGDLCPLPQLMALASQANAMVLVDEAHGTGVLGATGAGAVEHFGCSGQPLVQVGTLSKALGSLGGYVAGSCKLIEWLRNRAASWIYTTALSPADAAAALAAIRVMEQQPQRRQQLWQHIHLLKTQLQALLAAKVNGSGVGYRLLPSESAILCLQVPDTQAALQVAAGLRAAGIFAPAIRPPTVPTSRIRLSLMATHRPDQIWQLVTALVKALPV